MGGSAAYKAAKAKGVPLSKEAIDASFPFPWAFLLGWALYAAAYWFPAGSTYIQLTTPGMFASGFSVALSIIASIPMAYAVKNRKATLKKLLGLSFVLSWLGHGDPVRARCHLDRGVDEDPLEVP